uniref:Uncharacterized protein LOC111115634 n=1 Tax=Crassostrea virginica TaxID=6565 RepID=A0A8B8C4X5_CRAVI|nr:uncharacterized protein LOC111115634 [Crassostrea virginica]
MTIIEETFRKWTKKDNIRQIASGFSVPKVTLILRNLAEKFQADIYEELSKNTNQILIQRLQTELFHPIYSILNDAVNPFSSLWDSALAKESTTYFADEISKILDANEGRTTFQRIDHHIHGVFKSTENDAKAIFEEWSKLRWKFVSEWSKNENVLRKKELRYPVTSCIFGEKNGMASAKVFLSKSDAEAQGYFEKEFKRFGIVQLQIVDTSKTSKEIHQRMRKIKQHEKSAPPIDPDTKTTFNNIIRNKIEKLLENHSTVVALDISNVRQKGNKIVNEPCIAVYCLDETLRRYGENHLPKYLEGCPLDIREDYILFGHCQNCENRHPKPGCDIGRDSSASAGSIGFLVRKSLNDRIIQTEGGFLTAAHVAIKNFAGLYESHSLLTKNDFGNDDHVIIHPSATGKRIGKVVEAFCGNFGKEKTGLDIAFVKTDMPLSGELDESIFPKEEHIKCDGSMKVIKMGRTTGLTNGILYKDNCLVIVKCDQGGFLYFNDCYLIEDKNEPFFLAGDSGSGVFLNVTHGENKPLGIAFARLNSSTAVCKVKSFLDSLNLSVLAYRIPEEPMDVS